MTCLVLVVLSVTSAVVNVVSALGGGPYLGCGNVRATGARQDESPFFIRFENVPKWVFSP